MMNSNHKFNLREMQPSDSEAVANLITQFDGDMTTRFLVDPYTAMTSGTKYPTLGVVVESPGHDGLVGVGTVRFSEAQFNGEILPLGFLDGLKVHKDFRRQGLGYQIASWRIQQIREMYGDQCVIATGMAAGNTASRAVAKKWCREFIDPAITVRFLTTRTRRPSPLDEITVREISPYEYQEFSEKKNAFYKDYNLYEPDNPGSIAKLLGVFPEGKQPYQLFVAVDARGNLLAGAQVWSSGLLKYDTLNNPPTPLRVLNNVLHILPSDFVMRDIAVTGIWFVPGQARAARYMWEMIRWECRERGTTVSAGFDPRDPAQEAVTLKPWHMIRPKITIAIHGPTPIDRERIFFASGRV